MLTGTQRLRFESQLDALLHQDPHNGADGNYLVRSLYFDTPRNRDFQEKADGVELRKKLRLRIYSTEAATVLLEMKQKQGNNQFKRSLLMKREDAEQLAEGNFAPLLDYKEDFAAECYALINRDLYLPGTIVEYQRKAYVLPENDIRITLDSQIRAAECCGSLFFERSPGLYPVMDPWKTILEVKYNHFLLSYVRDIIRSCNQSELSLSKYCMARKLTLTLN